MNYHYKLFFQSNDGKEMAELFTPGKISGKLTQVYDLTKGNFLASVTKEEFSKTFRRCVETLAELKGKSEELFNEGFVSDIIGKLKKGKNNNRDAPTFIPYLSLALYDSLPDLPFYPVVYANDFDVFMRSCDMLGIELPEVPKQSKTQERLAYYLTICRMLEGFRAENGIKKTDVCALLYGYCLNVMKLEKKQEQALPDPTRIWFVGASRTDYGTVLQQKESAWQCNPMTNAGDIVIVYAKAPHSHVHSIWRALTKCSANPFDLHCNRIHVGHRIEVPNLSYNEMMNDNNLHKYIPRLNCKLQGINGDELSIEGYNYFLDLLKKKDPNYDIGRLPQVFTPEMDEPMTVKIEDEVSNKILIPCLKALGYAENDWKKELELKLGRDRRQNESGIKGRPDFTFFPQKHALGQQSSPFVIEVKYEMTTKDDQLSALSQAASYARMLQADKLAICDRNILMVYRANKEYFCEKDLVFNHSWDEIRDKQHPEVFSELKKLIGRNTIGK